MREYLIAYTFGDGCKGWLTVKGESQKDALCFWYAMDIDGRCDHIVELPVEVSL